MSGLEGTRVVVTRARDQARSLGDALGGAGAEVIYLPTIAIADPESWAGLDAALGKLGEGRYAWTVFTSVNAVTKLFGRMADKGLDSRLFSGTRVAAVGPVTAGALSERGIRADLRPARATGRDLAAAMGPGQRPVLVPRARGAPADLVDDLRAAGWVPEEVVAYRTVPAEAAGPATAAVRAGDFDVVTFTSGSTARSFRAVVAAPALVGLAPDDPPKRLVACIGPQTAAVAAACGFRVDIVASDHSARGLVDALTDHLRASMKR